MNPVNKILGTNFNPGEEHSWDGGDGSARVLKKDNKGVTFFVTEFGRFGTGEQHQVKKSWSWIKNHLEFFELN